MQGWLRRGKFSASERADGVWLAGEVINNLHKTICEVQSCAQFMCVMAISEAKWPDIRETKEKPDGAVIFRRVSLECFVQKHFSYHQASCSVPKLPATQKTPREQAH